jgi:hypothetical protein
MFGNCATPIDNTQQQQSMMYCMPQQQQQQLMMQCYPQQQQQQQQFMMQCYPQQQQQCQPQQQRFLIRCTPQPQPQPQLQQNMMGYFPQQQQQSSTSPKIIRLILKPVFNKNNNTQRQSMTSCNNTTQMMCGSNAAPFFERQCEPSLDGICDSIDSLTPQFNQQTKLVPASGCENNEMSPEAISAYNNRLFKLQCILTGNKIMSPIYTGINCDAPKTHIELPTEYADYTSTDPDEVCENSLCPIAPIEYIDLLEKPQNFVCRSGSLNLNFDYSPASVYNTFEQRQKYQLPNSDCNRRRSHSVDAPCNRNQVNIQSNGYNNCNRPRQEFNHERSQQGYHFNNQSNSYQNVYERRRDEYHQDDNGDYYSEDEEPNTQINNNYDYNNNNNNNNNNNSNRNGCVNTNSDFNQQSAGFPQNNNLYDDRRGHNYDYNYNNSAQRQHYFNNNEYRQNGPDGPGPDGFYKGPEGFYKGPDGFHKGPDGLFTGPTNNDQRGVRTPTGVNVRNIANRSDYSSSVDRQSKRTHSYGDSPMMSTGSEGMSPLPPTPTSSYLSGSKSKVESSSKKNSTETSSTKKSSTNRTSSKGSYGSTYGSYSVKSSSNKSSASKPTSSSLSSSSSKKVSPSSNPSNTSKASNTSYPSSASNPSNPSNPSSASNHSNPSTSPHSSSPSSKKSSKKSSKSLDRTTKISSRTSSNTASSARTFSIHESPVESAISTSERKSSKSDESPPLFEVNSSNDDEEHNEDQNSFIEHESPEINRRLSTPTTRSTSSRISLKKMSESPNSLKQYSSPPPPIMTPLIEQIDETDYNNINPQNVVRTSPRIEVIEDDRSSSILIQMQEETSSDLDQNYSFLSPALNNNNQGSTRAKQNYQSSPIANTNKKNNRSSVELIHEKKYYQSIKPVDTVQELYINGKSSKINQHSSTNNKHAQHSKHNKPEIIDEYIDILDPRNPRRFTVPVNQRRPLSSLSDYNDRSDHRNNSKGHHNMELEDVLAKFNRLKK